MKLFLGVLFIVIACRAQAQPTLPGIMCVQEGSTVRLTWMCQYEGIKAIIVKRSYDSLRNYNQIGTVGDVLKGAQMFVDTRPLQGRSYYKLNIVFKSGLNWGSNHCSIVSEGIFTVDTLTPHAGEGTMPRVKFKLSVPEMDLEASYVDPIYVRNNRTTGHVDVRLPEDFAKHSWSLVFYNSKKQVVMDIPVVRARNVVIDKRNFQRRGEYKFMLRRDGGLFEWGYVRIGE